MRDYLKEIEELRNGIKKIDEELIRLAAKEEEYRFAIIEQRNRIPLRDSLSNMIMSERSTEVLLELRRLTDIHEMIKNEIGRLRRKKGYAEFRIDYLLEEYRNAHSTDFYMLMDEIDICNLIDREGIIHCVKF